MRNIRMYSIFGVVVIYFSVGCVWLSGAFAAPKSMSGFDSKDNIGDNAVDKKGIPYIDGVNAKKVRFSFDESDIELSSFGKVFNKTTRINDPLDGVYCNVKIKNKTKTNHKIALFQLENEEMFFSVTEESGKHLRCAYLKSVFIINGFPYGLSPPEINVPSLGTFDDMLVFYGADLNKKQVQFTLKGPLLKDPKKFYVLLKDLREK